MIGESLINLKALESFCPGDPLLGFFSKLEIIDGEFIREDLYFLFDGEFPEKDVKLLSALKVGCTAKRPDECPAKYFIDDLLQILQLLHCDFFYLGFLVIFKEAVEDAH